MTARNLLVIVLLAVLGWLLVLWFVGLVARGFYPHHEAVQVVATDVSLPKFPQPTTTTSSTPTLPSTTTTVRPVARTAPTVAAASVGRPTPAAVGSSINGYPCGNDLPPCAVMRRESGGNPKAYNASGCSGHGCYGLWQFSGEWRCHFGLSCDIANWTVDEQNHAARTLWDGGRGCSHWAAC